MSAAAPSASSLVLNGASAPARGARADQGRRGGGGPVSTTTYPSTDRIGRSHRAVNFAANAPPTARPASISVRGAGLSDQHQRAYTERKMKSVTPRSVVTRHEWATTFGSRT